LIKRFRVLPEEIDEEAVYWSGLLSTLPADTAERILDLTGTPHSRRLLIIQALHSINTVPAQLNHIETADHQNLHHLLHELSIETLISLMAFALDKKNARKILYFIGQLRSIKCCITGKDLIAAGFKPGPHIRMIFQHITALRLEGKELTPQEELEIARELYQNI
jgi:tRNA nucleotidyltransferase (CCA-adding enzyme)